MRLASGLKKNLGGKISEPFVNGSGTFVLEAASTRAGDIRVRRVDSCEIDRLLLAQKITPHQHDTAEHFMSVLFRARMIGGGSSNWERGGCTTPHHTMRCVALRCVVSICAESAHHHSTTARRY